MYKLHMYVKVIMLSEGLDSIPSWTTDFQFSFISNSFISGGGGGGKRGISLPNKQVYIEKKKHPYDCFTNLSKDKHISMTALWCPAFGNHG